jgi:hypothetical protein
MIITYEIDGVAKLTSHEFPRPVINNDFEKVVRSNLAKHNIREQMVKDFKELCGNTPSDKTIGYALDEVSKKKYHSKVERVRFHYDKSIDQFNVKF